MEQPKRDLLEIFHHAADLSPDERESYLRLACEGDAELLKLARVLLLADNRVASRVDWERPALHLEAAASSMRQSSAETEMLGPYRLIGLAGRGGTGDVYRAVRREGGFEQQVAIKRLRWGIDWEPVVARFRAERQILANLDHPNIARLLDGGADSDGKPYIVIEYVDGKPMAEYCRDEALPLEARIQLFRRVCSAVHYAHQRMIIHRDIKPGNILVPGSGEPKLLDFGIAKLTGPDVLDSASYTATQVFTPGYASPEQFRGEPITTATDVYSLGVVLYELLSDKSPYGAESSSGPQRMMQAVCDMEPAATALPRDLDCIVRKALEKDPARRYSSADHLSEDLDRYLRGLPVHAAPATILYRLTKYARRDWKLVTAIAALVLSLASGVVATTWQARTAQAQRELAERRLRESRKLSQALVSDVQGALRNLPGTLAARQMILKRTVDFLDEMARDGAVDPDLQFELATAYDAAAEGTFDVQRARQLHEQALRIREALAVANPGHAGYASAYAESLQQVARNDRERGHTTSAIAAYRRSSAILESLSGTMDYQLQRQLAESYALLGQVLMIAGHREEARSYLNRYSERIEWLYARHPEDIDILQQRFVAIDGLAIASSELGDHQAAVQHARRNLTWSLELLQLHPKAAMFQRDHWVAQDHLGLMLLRANGGDQEAAGYIRQGLVTLEELIRQDPADTGHRRGFAVSQRRLGNALESAGHSGEALAAYRTAASQAEKLLLGDPAKLETRKDLALINAQSGSLLLRLGQFAGAEDALSKAVSLFEEAHRIDPEDAITAAGLAGARHDTGLLLLARSHPIAAAAQLKQAAQLWTQLSTSGTLSALDRDRPARTQLALASLKDLPAGDRPMHRTVAVPHER